MLIWDAVHCVLGASKDILPRGLLLLFTFMLMIEPIIIPITTAFIVKVFTPGSITSDIGRPSILINWPHIIENIPKVIIGYFSWNDRAPKEVEGGLETFTLEAALINIFTEYAAVNSTPIRKSTAGPLLTAKYS